MKSKIIALVMTTFLIGGIVNADQVSVYPVQQYFGAPYLNYMMGTVSLSGYVQNNPSTNLLPISNIGNNNSTCNAYLNTFNKAGDLSSEVAKLQQFLNQYNGANLNGLGFYGPATTQEVINLQHAYGINPTGAQFEKTTALVNAIKCGQVQPKARVVYYSNYNQSSVINLGQDPASNATRTFVPANIYPNPDSQNIPPTNNTRTIPGNNSTVNSPMTGKVPTSSLGTVTSTSSSFLENFGKDFDKIKENYKAYLLVFVLVLALFWFLRKAATE